MSFISPALHTTTLQCKLARLQPTTAMPTRMIAVEAFRGFIGVLLLPFLLVRLPSDEYVASVATGGEWVRLNGTTAVCFAPTPRDDHRCRYLLQTHCEAAICVWGNPSSERCVQVNDSMASCENQSPRQCTANKACSWTAPLEFRVACRDSPSNSPFGGVRCENVVAHRPGAIEQIRLEMQFLLAQIFAFGLCNLWLVRWHGSIDAVVADGKPHVVGLFVLVVMAGTARNELRGS